VKHEQYENKISRELQLKNEVLMKNNRIHQMGYKRNEDKVDKLKIKVMISYIQCEENEYRKNLKINFMLSARRTKISWTSDEEMRGKHETVIGHMAKYMTGRRRRRRRRRKRKRRRR
jgi:hypothetical protein